MGRLGAWKSTKKNRNEPLGNYSNKLTWKKYMHSNSNY